MHSAFFIQNELMPRSVCDASLIACRQASSNPLGDCAITSMLRTIDIQFLPSARSYVAEIRVTHMGQTIGSASMLNHSVMHAIVFFRCGPERARLSISSYPNDLLFMT